MDSRVLFSGKHIYDLVEERREQLKVAYDALPDNEALDEATTQALKKKFMLDVPTLRMNDWTSEREEISPYATEITAYIPFDGDPAVFYVQPSAFNGMLAYGEIVNHEILVRIRPNSANLDVPAYVRSQLKEIEWRLNSLRGSMEHMSQQLEITLREGMQRRRRMIENRVKLADNIGIPQRPPKTAPVVERKAAPAPTKPVEKKEPKLESWDVFMSHASPDKPYVRDLVKALRDGGVTVWFDEDHIEWGESVPREIRKGLLNSRYGIVVLSEAYLAERKWTEHEFQGLLARETLDTTVILPIWHKVTEEDVKKYDAPLTLRRAKISKTDAYPDIVASIQRKLGHEVSVSGETASPRTDRPAKDGPENREFVACAEYETKGTGAEFVYSEEAKADVDFPIAKHDEFSEIIRRLKIHDWFIQGPAIEQAMNLDWSKLNQNQIFVLGRNIYQCALGKVHTAEDLLRNLRGELAKLPTDSAIHMLNGMFFEVYFNREGRFRGVELKDDLLCQLLTVQAVSKFEPSVSFIHRALGPYKSRLVFAPSTVPKKVAIHLAVDESIPPVLKSFNLNGVELLVSVDDVGDFLPRSWWSPKGTSTLDQLEKRLTELWRIPAAQISIDCDSTLDRSAVFQVPKDFLIMHPGSDER